MRREFSAVFGWLLQFPTAINKSAIYRVGRQNSISQKSPTKVGSRTCRRQRNKLSSTLVKRRFENVED